MCNSPYFKAANDTGIELHLLRTTLMQIFANLQNHTVPSSVSLRISARLILKILAVYTGEI